MREDYKVSNGHKVTDTVRGEGGHLARAKNSRVRIQKRAVAKGGETKDEGEGGCEGGRSRRRRRDACEGKTMLMSQRRRRRAKRNVRLLGEDITQCQTRLARRVEHLGVHQRRDFTIQRRRVRVE
jgi:hypothetical protein